MLCFFTMGFVDLVGIASNYVQQDLGLTHAKADRRLPSNSYTTINLLQVWSLEASRLRDVFFAQKFAYLGKKQYFCSRKLFMA